LSARTVCVAVCQRAGDGEDENLRVEFDVTIANGNPSTHVIEKLGFTP
jgi:hypothetical protein